MADVDYEQVVQLAEQLTVEQQQQLISRLLVQKSQQQRLSAEEKMQILRAARVHAETEINKQIDMSDRREDWYGEDGR